MERRLAAILAADVVGYSRLMGADEAGTLGRLKALRKELVQPKIAERGGRIVKLMGDGLLAEFPSVVEAVQCAVDIQKEMTQHEPNRPDSQRIQLRIGVNQDAGEFQAHAWVERHGVVLNDHSDIHCRFAVFDHIAIEDGVGRR